MKPSYYYAHKHYDIVIPPFLPTKDISKYVQNHLDVAYELGLKSHHCRIFMPAKKYADFLTFLNLPYATYVMQSKTFWGIPLYIIHPDTAKPEVSSGHKTITYAPASEEEEVLDTIITMQ